MDGEMIMANECESDAGDEGGLDDQCGICGGEDVLRFKMDGDKSVVKKMLNPRLPSQEEVEVAPLKLIELGLAQGEPLV